jgi:peptidylprolyl isomerase domain and WD repeat-containing protein 1
MTKRDLEDNAEKNQDSLVDSNEQGKELVQDQEEAGAIEVPEPKKPRYSSIDLPFTDQYEVSFMHRDVVKNVMVLEKEFIVTTSIDGHLKFWKIVGGLEFVKHYRAHIGLIVDLTKNKQMLATCGSDKYIKIFDILNFDMINMLKLEYLPFALCFYNQNLLGCSDKDSGQINVYDCLVGPLYSVNVHKSPVHLMKYNPFERICVSVDESGAMEYWKVNEDGHGDPGLRWKVKSETDLYEFKKIRSRPTSLEFSNDGTRFVTFEFKDRTYRIWDFAKAKIIKRIDESLENLEKQQESFKYLADMDFGRRLALEKEIEKTQYSVEANAVFDESGNYLLYPTLFGIKIINLKTNAVQGFIGKAETIRFMNISLYQGAPKKKALLTVEMAASDNSVIRDAEETEPTLLCTAFKKQRFYCFTKREPDTENQSNRDIFNEKPSREEQTLAAANENTARLGTNCIMHTTFGDIYIRLFPEFAPLAVENFITLSTEGTFF